MRWALLIGLIFVSLEPRVAMAQVRDSAGERLDLSTDATPPHYRTALSVDLVQLFYSRAALSMEFALTRAQSVRVTPIVDITALTTSAALELGYRVWPFGDGLRGIWFGPNFTPRLVNGQVFGTISADAGWHFVQDGLLIGFGVGVGYAPRFSQVDASVCLRVQAILGYSWR